MADEPRRIVSGPAPDEWGARIRLSMAPANEHDPPIDPGSAWRTATFPVQVWVAVWIGVTVAVVVVPLMIIWPWLTHGRVSP